MFELVVIGVCMCVGFSVYSVIEWCFNEVKDLLSK